MPPVFTAREICRKLRKIGFIQDKQTGSHAVYEKNVGDDLRTVIVPIHHGDCKYGTFRNILKQAHITLEEWNQIK